MSNDVPICTSCQEPFDADEVVPRVLTCGHSLCEICIPRLVLMNPPACPTCRAPIRVGNLYLYPKNFELLRFIAPSPKPRRESRPPPKYPEFVDWSHRMISRWKKWILDPEFVDARSLHVESGTVLKKASIDANRSVSLLPLRPAPSVSVDCEFRPSYMGRVLDVLNQMEGKEGNELYRLLEAVSKLRYGVARVYGLWMDDCTFYLVCESSDRDVLGLLSDKGKRFSNRVIGMELCEAVMGLHSQGIVCGVLSASCFLFDSLGHCLLDLNNVTNLGMELRETVESSGHEEGYNQCWTDSFVSPELFLLLCGHENSSESRSEISYYSDVWSLACLLIILFGGSSSSTDLFKVLSDTNLSINSYNVWMEEALSTLEDSSDGEDIHEMKATLRSSLNYEPKKRPHMADIWKCIRKLVSMPPTDHNRGNVIPYDMEKSIKLLFLSSYTPASRKSLKCLESPSETLVHDSHPHEKVKDMNTFNNIKKDAKQIEGKEVNKVHFAGTQDNLFKSLSLEGHCACITGLAIGGKFLFSSSNDKTIRAWSLQDFSYSHTLIGHEHRITTIVVVESTKKLCVSADFGGFICAWAIDNTSNQGPLKKWLEHTEWRFGKVNSLATDEYRIFSCSADKSINVWSLKDFNLLQKMEGHDSAVGCLSVANGILYSSSHDGTIRLWWLDDYTTMKVLKNDAQCYCFSALSLSVDDDLLVATYENGYIKIWRNYVPMKVMQLEDGAVFASQMVKKKLLFTGGWNKVIEIQTVLNESVVDVESFGSIKCHSAVTSLLHWEGMLVAGFANKDIKVYFLEKF